VRLLGTAVEIMTTVDVLKEVYQLNHTCKDPKSAGLKV